MIKRWSVEQSVTVGKTATPSHTTSLNHTCTLMNENAINTPTTHRTSSVWNTHKGIKISGIFWQDKHDFLWHMLVRAEAKWTIACAECGVGTVTVAHPKSSLQVNTSIHPQVPFGGTLAFFVFSIKRVAWLTLVKCVNKDTSYVSACSFST